MSDVVDSPARNLEGYRLAQTAAMRSAIQENAKDLSLDEQFLIAATLKKLARAGDKPAEKLVYSLRVRITAAAFARYANVDDRAAMRRLDAASDALFKRSCVATYPSSEGAAEIEAHFRWIDSRRMGESFVIISWTTVFAREFVRAHEAAKMAGSKTPRLAFVPESSVESLPT